MAGVTVTFRDEAQARLVSDALSSFHDDEVAAAKTLVDVALVEAEGRAIREAETCPHCGCHYRRPVDRLNHDCAAAQEARAPEAGDMGTSDGLGA